MVMFQVLCFPAKDEGQMPHLMLHGLTPSQPHSGGTCSPPDRQESNKALGQKKKKIPRVHWTLAASPSSTETYQMSSHFYRYDSSK